MSFLLLNTLLLVAIAAALRLTREAFCGEFARITVVSVERTIHLKSTTHSKRLRFDTSIDQL
jgi:hypothetical protein